MAEERHDIIDCASCGKPMDVSAVGPFTNVECPHCGEHTRAKVEFGAYTLLRRHAVGGMSMVFVAKDETLDREVVVKILSEDYSADEKRIAAFEEEARITALIGHPHVVRVYTTGRAFGRFYIAMEFVQGGHYEHRIRECGSIPESEALPLMIQVAEGLNAAHQAGLIHRDIKPGNILTDRQGQAKIVDFGLALITQGGTAQAEELWATPYYVPPETVEGLSEDFRSDLYAFGATFYHALAGEPSCNEETMDTDRLREAKRAVVPLRKARPRLGVATAELIDRCMAYRPEDRFGSYEALLEALKLAKLESGSGRRQVRRSSGRLAAAGLLALVILVGVVVWIRLPEKKVVPEVADRSLPVVSPVVPEPQAANDGLEVAATYQEAGEALAAKDYQRARELFAQVRDDPGVLEPTGSWAACEAVIAGFLEGRSAAAREEAGKGLDHIRSSNGLPSDMADAMEQTLSRVGELAPFRDDAVADGMAGLPHLLGMLRGLKNWEQGMRDQALPYLERVSQAAPTGDQAWLAPYVELAGDYVVDARRLREAEPETFEFDDGDYDGLIDELHALHVSLRTKGRARFDVRSWQLDLEKHRRRGLMKTKPAPADLVGEVDADEAPFDSEGFFAAARAMDFEQARALLAGWQPSTEVDEQRQEALEDLLDAASGFLAGLGDRAGDADDLELAHASGVTYHSILSSDSRGGMVRGEGLEPVRIVWAEVDPESLIDAHRQLSRKEPDGATKLERHAQAIGYGLLVGDQREFEVAASRLAETSLGFQLQWDRWRSALGL